MRTKLILGTLLVAIAAVGGGVYFTSSMQDNAAQTTAQNVAQNTPAPQQNTLQLAQAQLDNTALHPALKLGEHDYILGDENAPVTIIEYASMTCGHCGYFHNNVLPQIKRNYIDTGKVRMVVRPLPWDNMALAISKVAMCGGEPVYYPMLNAFFDTQEQWLKSEADALADIKKIARLSGMDGETVEACIKDKELHDVVLDTKETARQTLKVTGTPTFFVNGERLEGMQNFERMQEVIEAALNATQEAA